MRNVRMALPRVAGLLALMSATQLAASKTVSAPTARIEPIDCAKLSTVAPGQKATCGFLLVPENRSVAKSPTLRLPFLILRSRSTTPKPDPVLFMSGGPGNSTIRTRISGRGIPMLDERDYILFEQRGAKLAQPSLPCEEWGRVEVEAALGNISGSEVAHRKLAASKTCADRAWASGIDLNMYNSTEAARDVNDLRRALGLEQLNLYGLSYSAGIMLRVARDFPRSVRSIVLNSPLPIEVNFDEQGAAGLLRSLEMIFASCALNDACARAFPNPRAQMIETIARADREPIALDVPSPDTEGRIVRVVARGRAVADALLNALNDTEQMEVLPRTIDQVYRRDYHALASLVSVGPSNYSWLMRLAVWCNEETPFEDWNRVDAQRESQYAEFGLSEPEVHPAGVCASMRLGNVKPRAIENQPVVTDVPVLVINGELDPYTPVPWGRQMLISLSKGYHIVVPGETHGAGFSRCPSLISAQFYVDPTHAPDASCLMTAHGLDIAKAAQLEKPAT